MFEPNANNRAWPWVEYCAAQATAHRPETNPRRPEAGSRANFHAFPIFYKRKSMKISWGECYPNCSRIPKHRAHHGKIFRFPVMPGLRFRVDAQTCRTIFATAGAGAFSQYFLHDAQFKYADIHDFIPKSHQYPCVCQCSRPCNGQSPVPWI